MRGVLRLFAPRSYMDRQRRAGLLFVLPALVYFGLVFLVPLVESVVGSFHRIVPGGESRFVGLRLYQRVFTDSTFWQAVANTVSLLLMSVPVTVTLALAVEHLAEVVEVRPAVGGDVQRHALDLRHRLQRRDRHPEEGKEHAERAGRHQRDGEPAEPAGLQYSTSRRKSRHCTSVTSRSDANTNTAMTEASPSRKNLKAVS